VGKFPGGGSDERKRSAVRCAPSTDLVAAIVTGKDVALCALVAAVNVRSICEAVRTGFVEKLAVTPVGKLDTESKTE